jgi:heterodisulfide reductase subunit A-like polyferredoxin
MAVEIDKHQNVVLSTPSEMKRSDDEIKNITVIITKYLCYIWKTNGISCDDLAESYPVEAHNEKFSEDINIKKSIYKPSAQVMPNWVAKDNLHFIGYELYHDVYNKNAVPHVDENHVETSTIQAATFMITTNYTFLKNDPKNSIFIKSQYTEQERLMGISVILALLREMQQMKNNLALPTENPETNESKNLKTAPIVLSIDMKLEQDIVQLAKSIDLPLNAHNFLVPTDTELGPARTIHPDINAAGNAITPKGIPDLFISDWITAIKSMIDFFASEAKQ